MHTGTVRLSRGWRGATLQQKWASGRRPSMTKQFLENRKNIIHSNTPWTCYIHHNTFSKHTYLMEHGSPDVSAKIAEWAPSVHTHFNRGAKRQFWELCLETYIKMSGHSARSCLHLAESDQNKIDVTPHDWSVHSPWVQTGFAWWEKWRNRV